MKEKEASVHDHPTPQEWLEVSKERPSGERMEMVGCHLSAQTTPL